MKRKGFTLIELLAVIVILAIIALIATPIVLNIIEKAEKGAAKSSAYGVVESLKLKYAESLLDGSFNGVSYSSSNWKDLGINTEPEDGTVTLDSNGHMSGAVTYNGYTFYICNDRVSEEDIAKNCGVEDVPSEPVVPEEPVIYTKYDNGTAIYFNPETNAKCSANEAISTPETKTGCMKWYAFNDHELSSTVNVILDHNTTSMVQWNSDNINTEMKEAKISLVNDIATWHENIKNTARLITADEIAQITGNTTFNSATSNGDEHFYFETNTSTAPTIYAGTYRWLYNYTHACTNWGCEVADSSTYGYWTSSAISGSTTNVWSVYICGNLDKNTSADYTHRGVRPVITIPKSNL